jgi:hypothetical protein
MPGKSPAKFWHPLSLWQVLLIFLVAGLVATFSVVALREGLGLRIPDWVAGGLGGGLGVAATGFFAARKRRAS